jgi:hypothetical protein
MYLSTLYTYLHYIPIYIIYLSTLYTYLHYIPLYVIYLSTLYTYLHYIHLYVIYLSTLYTYIHYIPTYIAFYFIKFQISSPPIHPRRTNNCNHLNHYASSHSSIYRNTNSTVIIFNRRNPQSSTNTKSS